MKPTVEINSNRKFEILISEAGSSIKKGHTLNALINLSNNAYEYLYSLNDDIDKVLDLKDGDSMYFKPNRDNDLAKGIITRNDKADLRR